MPEDTTPAETPEILSQTDDPLTRILHVTDKIEDKLEQIDGLDEQLTYIKQSLEENRARVEKLEDGSNTNRSFTSKYGEVDKNAIGQWLRDVHRHTFYPESRADLEAEWRASGDMQKGGTDADGGFTVPDVLEPEILRIVEGAGVGRELCRVLPMGSDVVNLTARDTGTSVISVSFVSEGAAATEGKEAFRRVTLTANKLVGLGVLTEELEADSNADIAAYLIEVFGEAVAKKEDDVVFTLTTPFTNIVDTSGIGSVSMSGSFSTLSYDNLVDVIGTVDANIRGNGTFVFHPDRLDDLRKIKDTTGNPIWGPMATNQPATILGRPYRTANQFNNTDTTGKAAVLYGDFQNALFGTRGGFSAAFSSETGFTSGTTWLRVMERIAFAVAQPSAFGKIVTA